MKKQHIFFVGLGLAVLFSILVLVPSYFPYLGISLWLMAFSSIVYTLKPKTDTTATVLYVLSLISALFVSIRAEGFLTFLNIAGAIYFGGLMALHTKERSAYGLLEVFISPFVLFLHSIVTKNKYIFQVTSFLKAGREISPKRGKEIIIGSVIAMLLLWIIIPLLSSVNPIFGQWVEDSFSIFDISFLFGDSLPLQVGRIVAAILLAFFIPRFLSRTHQSAGKLDRLPESRGGVNLSIPKIAVMIVLGVFFLSQAQLYVASSETLASFGYSNSDLAREVFGQLSVVTLVVFGLIYYDKRKSTLARNTTYILVAFGFLLSLVALKSVVDYISNWGLTEKRLYGLATVFWLYGLYTLFIRNYMRKIIRTAFVQKAVIWTGIVLFVINIVNFDYLIFHRSQARDPHGIDHDYLAGLSADTLAKGEHVEFLFEQLKLEDADAVEDMHYIDRYVVRRAATKVERLQEKYTDLDIRGFNLNEFISYRRARHIDTGEIRAYTDPGRTSGPHSTSEIDYPF